MNRCMDICNQIQANIFSSMRMTKLPCQGICKIDSNQLCIGCNRTVQEIIEAGQGK